MLSNMVIAGMRSAGAQVVDLGETPTPVALTWLTGHPGFDGAVLVTGSHMGPDRIGLIPINANGTYCWSDVTRPLEDAIPGFFETPRQGVHPLKQMRLVQSIDPMDRDRFYVERALKGVDPSVIRSKNFRTLIDPGNATGTAVSRALLRELGCEVTVINGEPQIIPNRPSEVRPKNCGVAMGITRGLGLDLGACFDGDADRVMFITADGIALAEDVVAAIFAKAVLQAGDVCVSTINTSGLMAEVCRNIGARLVHCRIGQPDTGRVVLQHGARYASEPSAKYWFGDLFNWYDGPFAVAKMLEIMAMRGMTLAELAAELPVYHQCPDNIDLPDDRKAAVCAEVIRRLRQRLVEDIVKEDDMDGIRFTLRDGSWLLVRPSGTEPLCRVYSDSANEERARSLTALGTELFTEVLAT